MNFKTCLILIISLFLIYQISGLINFSYVFYTNLYVYNSIFTLIYSYLFGAFLSVHCQSYFSRKKTIWIVFCSVIFAGYLFKYLRYYLYPNTNTWFDLSASNQSFLSFFSAFAFFSLFKTFNIKFNKFIKFLSVMATLLYAYHEGVMNFLNIWFKETGLDHISRWKFMNYFFKFAVILPISIGFSILFYYPFIIYSKFTNKKMTKLIEYINKDKIKRIETKKNC